MSRLRRSGVGRTAVRHRDILGLGTESQARSAMRRWVRGTIGVLLIRDAPAGGLELGVHGLAGLRFCGVAGGVHAGAMVHGLLGNCNVSGRIANAYGVDGGGTR